MNNYYVYGRGVELVEELLELLHPTGLQVGLAQWRTEREIRELSLLLLDLQKTRLDGVLDDELDGRHRALLSKSMLRRNEERLLRCQEWDGTYDTVDGLVLDSGVPRHDGSEHHGRRLEARSARCARTLTSTTSMRTSRNMYRRSMRPYM